MYYKYYVKNDKDYFKNGIYLIYHMNKPKIYYVGSALRKSNNKSKKGVQSRWREHLCLLKNNKHHSPYLQNIFNKYGIDGIRFEMIDEVDENINIKDLRILEKQYIIKYNCIENGYNSSEVTYGYSMGLEQRKKQSERMKLNNPMKNPTNVKKAIENREPNPLLQYDLEGNFIKEYKNTQEASNYINRHTTSISEAVRGKRNKCNNSIWIRKNEFSEELLKFKIKQNKTKKKREISQGVLKKYIEKISKPIFLKEIKTGKIIEFSSIKEAHDVLGLDRGGLSNCCNGKRKYIKGYEASFKCG